MPPIIRPFQEIAPFCRFAGRIVIPTGNPMPLRTAYDHRLFFALDDHAVIQIADSTYPMQQGSCALVLSGTPYAIQAKDMDVAFIAVNFDFFPNGHQATPTPLPMTAPGLLNRSRLVEHISFEEGIFSEGYVHLPGQFRLTPWLESLVSEYERAELLHGRQTRSLLTLCLNHIFRRLMQSVPQRSVDAHQDILDFIAAHYCEPLTNRDIAERFHYHPNYVNHIVQKQTGLSLHRYLLRLRIHRATELLLSGSESISNIARMTGFSDANYFTQYFKMCVGVSPSTFRGDHTPKEG